MKGLAGQTGVPVAVTAVTGPSAADLGDFASESKRRLAASRARTEAERADKAKRLARPAKDEARANVADSHVERVILDAGKLRFGYGIDRMVLKGKMPVAALKTCERFRREFELANSGGALAVVDPTRVRVDSSGRPPGAPAGAAVSDLALRKAIEAIGGTRSPASVVLIRCVAEGKTLEAAAGELSAFGLGNDRHFARGLLVGGVFALMRHYGY